MAEIFLYGQHVSIAQCPLAAFGVLELLWRVVEKRKSGSLPPQTLLLDSIVAIAFQIPVFKTPAHFL